MLRYNVAMKEKANIACDTMIEIYTEERIDEFFSVEKDIAYKLDGKEVK